MSCVILGLLGHIYILCIPSIKELSLINDTGTRTNVGQVAVTLSIDVMKHYKNLASPQRRIVEEIMLQIKHVKNKEDNDETQ